MQTLTYYGDNLCSSHQAILPYKFWTFTLTTVVCLINWLPSPILNNQAPYQLLLNRKPDYIHLCVFRSLCYSWTPTTKRNKFQLRTIPCFFLGYASRYKAFKCYDMATNNVYTSRHVNFHVNIFSQHILTTPSPSAPSYINMPPPLMVSITSNLTNPSNLLKWSYTY